MFIMNKKNILLTAGLLLSAVTVALPVGKKAKDIVKIMHELNQDFNQSTYVKENIDRLIYLFGMNIKLAEKQLQSMSWNMTTVVKAINAIGGIAIADYCIGFATKSIPVALPNDLKKVGAFFVTCSTYAMVTYVALKAYDAFKSRTVLEKSLALDRAILAKLIELREAMTLQDSIEADEYDQHVELRLI